MADGLRISQLPDLGAVQDNDVFPATRANSGKISAAAIKAYVSTDLAALGPAGTVTSSSRFAGVGQAGTGYFTPDAIRDYVNTGKVFYPYGATGNGVTDDSPAIQAAINLASSAGGGTVLLPVGRFKLLSSLTIRPYVRLQGMGGVSSTLVLASASMAGVQMLNAGETVAQISIAHINFEQAAAGTKGVYLRLCRFTDLEGLTFQGVSMPIEIDRGLSHSIRHIRSVGTSVYPAGGSRIHSSVDNDYVHHATIVDYQIVNQGTGGPQVGIYFRRAINCILAYCTIYGMDGTAVVVENDSQAMKISHMVIAGCSAGVIIQQGTGIAVRPTYTSVTDSLIDQAVGFGIRVDSGMYTTIQNVQFTPNANTTSIPAIDLINAFDVIVANCRAEGLTGPNGCFVNFNTTPSDVVHIYGNTIRNCAAGIFVQVPGTNIVVESNIFSTVNNPKAGTILGVGNGFRNNPGMNPISITAPAVPASGTPFTNSTGVDLRIFLESGSGVQVRINGALVNVNSVPNGFVLRTSEVLTLTYTTAPTWYWGGL
jgi:hypothetical protein